MLVTGHSYPSSTNNISHFGIFTIITALYLVVIFAFFYPYVSHFSTHLIGPPEDNMQDLWNTFYAIATLDTNPTGFFFTDTIKYPEGTSLYYQSFAYPHIFIIWIIHRLFSIQNSLENLIPLQNAMLILSYYLAAIGAFYLTLFFTNNVVSALFGGFVFGFNPSHLAHTLHHQHVATIEFIPLFILLFMKCINTPKIRYILYSVMLFVLSALSCWYYLFYILYFLCFYCTYQVFTRKRLVIKEIQIPILVIVFGSILVLSPLLLPMLIQGLQSQNVYAHGHNTFVADLLGYVTFHPYHLLSKIARPIYVHFTGNEWESTVYIGLINIGLFVWGFINRKRLGIKEMPFLLCGMLLFMLFASGVSLHVMGVSTIPVPTGVTASLPFLKNVRTPSRAIVFVYLFLGVGVGVTIRAIMARYSGKWGILVVVPLLVVAGCMFLDFFPGRVEVTPVSCPVAYDIIRRDADPDFGILDLPRGYKFGNAYMMYQICHRRSIVVATTTRDMYPTLSDQLEMTDLKKQREKLIESHVKYIVIHRDIPELGWVGYAWPEEDGDVDSYEKAYPAVYADKSRLVLKVY